MASTDATPVKSGDLVELDYEVWAEGGGTTTLVDTTRESVAAQANVTRDDATPFGPRPHLIGGEFFPKGIEAALVGRVPGEEFTQTFPPAEAFGERDPKLIELFSMAEIQRLPEMRREEARLDVGTLLTIRGRRGRVVSLTAARVRVDFNSPLAGRTIRATLKIVRRINEPADQARALIELHYGRSRDFSVDLADGVLTVGVADRSKFDLGWVAAKPRLIEAVRRHLQPKKIRLVEEYVTPPASTEKAPATPEATPTPGPSNPPSPPAAEPAPSTAEPPKTPTKRTTSGPRSE